MDKLGVPAYQQYKKHTTYAQPRNPNKEGVKLHYNVLIEQCQYSEVGGVVAIRCCFRHTIFPTQLLITTPVSILLSWFCFPWIGSTDGFFTP
jgi:hypothetical protein